MPTIEYVYREVEKGDIDLHWMCLPIKHTSACSPEQPYWHCWDEAEKDAWCRPLPNLKKYPKAKIWHIGNITEPFEREPLPTQNNFATKQMGCTGTVAMLVGLRASESLRRYRIVAMKGANALNYVSTDILCKRVYMVKPIYDFSTEDIWTAHYKFQWDHNTSYDDQERAGISRHEQRVCPPFGAEPLRGLYMYQTCYPELAEKMLYRVKGAATAIRYSRTALYGFRETSFDENTDPQEQIDQALMRWKTEQRMLVQARIESEIKNHKRKGGGEIPLMDGGKTGITWKYLYMLAIRGDFKNRRNPTYKKEK